MFLLTLLQWCHVYRRETDLKLPTKREQQNAAFQSDVKLLFKVHLNWTKKRLAVYQPNMRDTNQELVESIFL